MIVMTNTLAYFGPGRKNFYWMGLWFVIGIISATTGLYNKTFLGRIVFCVVTSTLIKFVARQVIKTLPIKTLLLKTLLIKTLLIKTLLIKTLLMKNLLIKTLLM